MWTLLVAAALAAPPTFTATVQVDPTEPRPAPVESAARDAVNLIQLDVIADGSVESAWVVVDEAPPLSPRELGPRPPPERSRVALAHDRLVVLAPLLGKRFVQTWVLDPDGLGQRWWRWRIDEGVVTAERCGYDGVTLERASVVPSRALPCEPTDQIRSGMGKTGWEVGFPRDGLTSAARLGWSVTGPNAAGGTWGPSGRDDNLPEQGRTLALRAVGARVDAVPDPDAGLWHVTVTPKKALPGTWSWRVVGSGEVLDQGTIDAAGEEVRFDMPWRHRPDTGLEIRPGVDAGGVPLAWLRPLGDPAYRAWVRSPVAQTSIELGYVTPVDRAGVVVHVTDAKARVVAETKVDLTAGTGVIRVTGDWPAGALRVVVDGLMPDGATVVVTR
jgi:hypothetical protein